MTPDEQVKWATRRLVADIESLRQERDNLAANVKALEREIVNQRDGFSSMIKTLEALLEEHKDLLNDLLKAGMLPEHYAARAAVLVMYP